MNVRFIVATVALATLPLGSGAAVEPLRAIEVAELHRSLDPGLLAALSGEPRIAGRAALAVGRTKRPAGAAYLRPLLAAPDPGERAMAVYALGLLADAGSLDDVRRLARSDPNSAVRYAAADAAGRVVFAAAPLQTREVATDLLIVARADVDPIVRAHAAAALEAFGAQPFAPELARALQRLTFADREPDVRWHAAWTVFRGYARTADRSLLARALHSSDELVRVEALRAWGRRSDPGAARLVRPLLGDPSWRVQFEAREALRRLAKLPPTEHLKAMPPGVHVPPVGGATAVAGPVPSLEAAPAGKPAAPDPATLALPAYASLPATAAEMNGPARGPHPRVLVRTTKGDVVVRLYPEWAPSTVANFLALAARGYFDGNRWFRIVPDFVVQTGDPNDNGEGDAGYAIPAEENPVEQRTGVIAMGLNYEHDRAVRDSAGTQFYMTVSPQLHLDRDFSVFGEIERGFAVAANLIETDRMTFVRRIADD